MPEWPKAKLIEWIDAASYEDLLRMWRFAPAGDPLFKGEVGAHFAEVMTKRRAETPDNGVSASKRLG